MQLGNGALRASGKDPNSTYQSGEYSIVWLTGNGQGGICAFLQGPTNVTFGKIILLSWSPH